jgi:class 3 adenylate cyclase/CheY-like chemotaxis protein
MADHDDEELTFAEEKESNSVGVKKTPWKILIVDDEEDVHKVTCFALRDFKFLDRGLELLSARSSPEAIDLLTLHRDIAICILDVVMESEDAGLRLVKFIREELGNYMIRIVLRTGQPGSAPERTVIIDYDINDYKAKTELTSQKLFTTMIGSLRAYRDLVRMDSNKKGLERIIDASVSIFSIQSIEKFITGMMMQISSILGLNQDSACYITGGLVSTDLSPDPNNLLLLAGIGRYANKSSTHIDNISEDKVKALIQRAHESQKNIFEDRHLVFYFKSKHKDFILYLENEDPSNKIDTWNLHLIELFCNNFAIAFDNIILHQNMEELNRAYSHFAPSDAIHFLNKKSIIDISLGESIQRPMGILFLDIRDFTSRTERTSPRACFNFLNSFLAYVGPVVDLYGGVINKYLGDGFLAIFEEQNNLPQIIAECAIEIVKATEIFNRRSIEEDNSFEPVKIGMGLAMGPATLGTMGYRERLEFTLIGDTVNIASRLESLNKTYNTTILVSENIAQKLVPWIGRRKMGDTPIKGKKEKVEVWEIFSSEVAVKAS